MKNKENEEGQTMKMKKTKISPIERIIELSKEEEDNPSNQDEFGNVVPFAASFGFAIMRYLQEEHKSREKQDEEEK